MDILLATQNVSKKNELCNIFPTMNFYLPYQVGLMDWDHEETADTFCGNALGKALSLWRAAKGQFPVLSDDSGLCVDALNGAPGVYSARFGQTVDKQKLTDAEKNTLLLEKLENIQHRRAHFVCALVLVFDNLRQFFAQETWEGEIFHKSVGSNGFGYDPIFYIPKIGKCSAELTAEHKNSISHRARAARRLNVLLEDLTKNP